MSNLSLLPLYQLSAGIQNNEDWTVSLFVAQADGATPVDLTGIAFTARVGGYAPIVVNGDATGLVVIAAPASQVATWAPGYYPLSILATAADGTRALAAVESGLTVGADRSLTSKLLASESGVAFASSLRAAVFASLAALPEMQAGASSAPVGTGQPYLNSDGFVVIAQ